MAVRNEAPFSPVGVVMPTGGLAVPGTPQARHGSQISRGSNTSSTKQGGSQYSCTLQWNRSSFGSASPGSRTSSNSSPPRKSMVARKPAVRRFIQDTQWYHGKLATEVRNVIHGKLFALVSVLALLLALFLPDFWVLAGANSNIEIDVILTFVMVLFAGELVLLSAVDATYFLGFFFFMDVVGTVSMIFDISFMLGKDHTEADTFEDKDVQKNLMLLRAARAARVGARAGRLSRVVRMLRMLPLLKSQAASPESHIAKAISGQLANLLATRVACLTIVLVMVIPLFEILTFPQIDYSLQTWAQRLSEDLVQGRQDALLNELRQLVEFYRKKSYGPFRACRGAVLSNKFTCAEEITGWQPIQSKPSRGASILQIRTNVFMLAFNMHSTAVLESSLASVNILFIMFIMVFSSLALSSVVTALAVRPLERMLQTVKDIAQQVFKIGLEVADEKVMEHLEEEEYDIDSSSEMHLLEKVVQKLAIIADIKMNTFDVNTDEMEEEDIGILSMMQGHDIVEEKAKMHRRSMAVSHCQMRPSGAGLAMLTLPHKTTRSLEDECGINLEMYNSMGFNALSMDTSQRVSLCKIVITTFHSHGDWLGKGPKDEAILPRFIGVCAKEYPSNPFHNFAHATDVTHSVARILRHVFSEGFLTEVEQFALLIGAVAHDLGHPGVNNGFLSEVGHDLALEYNDKSPLENMHCAKLYTIVNEGPTNVFVDLSRDQYKEVRKHCIETILHTDMMGHNAMVKELQMTWQMHTEIFNMYDGGANTAAAEVFSKAESKSLAMNAVLHSADVSNPCRLWVVSHAWAMVVLEEFFAQGDQEKMLGVPVQFLNDRDKLNRPNSQIGFIEFVIAPFFVALVKLWPKMDEYGDHLGSNLGQWEEMWAEEVAPTEEERAKVLSRVQKAKDSLEQAKPHCHSHHTPHTRLGSKRIADTLAIPGHANPRESSTN